MTRAALGGIRDAVATFAPSHGTKMAASVATRAGAARLSIGIQNPRLRLFSWRTGDDPRGFAICDQASALEACWDR